jgi:hypothetical protein
MSLLAYALIGLFIMLLLHFALNPKGDERLSLLSLFYVSGAIVGWYFQSYETGLIFAIVLSMLMW